VEQSAEQNGVDAAAKANLAVHFDDGHALVKPLAQARIVVDIDELWTQPVRLK
jgi:hypothetical protein